MKSHPEDISHSREGEKDREGGREREEKRGRKLVLRANKVPLGKLLGGTERHTHTDSRWITVLMIY